MLGSVCGVSVLRRQEFLPVSKQIPIMMKCCFDYVDEKNL